MGHMMHGQEAGIAHEVSAGQMMVSRLVVAGRRASVNRDAERTDAQSCTQDGIHGSA